MTKIESIIRSTAIDAHGDIMTRESLVQAAEVFKTNNIQIGYEHDPRQAPLGRFVEGWVEDLPSGISVLKARGELFDADDVLPKEIGRKIVEKTHSGKSIVLTLDMSYGGSEFREEIGEISKILGSDPQCEIKKAVEPLSILSLSGCFVLGAIASGFFGQIGSDFYELLKKQVKKLFVKQRKRTKENLMVLEFDVTYNDKKIAVHTIVTNPEDSSIDGLFGNAIHELDKIPADLFSEEHHLSRLVYSYENEKLVFLYGVREDGYPIRFRNIEKSTL